MTAPAHDALDTADTARLLDRQHRVLELLAGGAGRAEVLGAVTLALEELIPGSRCSVLVLDAARGTLHHGAAPSLPAAYSAAIDGMPIGDDAGSCGTAAYRDEAVVAEDIARDTRWDRFRAIAQPYGLGSCWSSPIRGHDGVLGTFAVYHARPHRPDERERRLVARFTDLAAVALEHDRLYGALAQSEERFRRAFEDNAVGMALTDLGGRFLRVNDALAAMVGHPATALLARDLDAVLRPEDRVGARLLLRGLAAGTAPPSPLEVSLVRGDGRAVQAALTASVVGAGTSRHVSLNVVDVTARVAAQRDRAARREAELAARVAEDASRAKSEMLSTLSHELRTPLQAIIGFSELLGTLDLPPTRREAALGHIDAAARHVLDLVGEVLDLARLEARALPLAPGTVDLAVLVHEVLELLEPVAARRGIRLGTDLPATGGPTVCADPRRVRQVLINLVTNGVRHNHLDGWVRVEARGGADGAVLAVSDGGPGVPPALVHRLFEPFAQLDGGEADDAGGGTGLGLALVRGLVEAMAGTVTVESAPGEGTTATVRLPGAGALRRRVTDPRTWPGPPTRAYVRAVADHFLGADRGADDVPGADVETVVALLSARGSRLGELLARAAARRDAHLAAQGRVGTVTYSPKVFVPLTRLCRDRCHYCTFATVPGRVPAAYLELDEVLDIARAGAAQGCTEVLFTLGDRPEARWRAAGEWLDGHGYTSTIDYVRAAAQAVLDETGLLPHLNPGVMSPAELAALRPVAPSMGMMLESTSTLLVEPGGAHFGSPDKDPAVRLRAIADAGRARVPFTTGILVGIGETRRDRAESLLALARLAGEFGHLQEVIVQNFRAKPDTAMRGEPDAEFDEFVAAVAVARLLMPIGVSVQAPPNLAGELGDGATADSAHRDQTLLLRAGIDDWGGVSPVTPDHVNPERPWPGLDDLARVTADAGRAAPAVDRLPPVHRGGGWIDPAVAPAVAALADDEGLAAVRDPVAAS